MPQFKAYTINGPATYQTQDLFRVYVQDTLDTLESPLSARLLRWAADKGFYPDHVARSGGGAVDCYFLVEHKDQVLGWLQENGLQPNQELIR
jgi:hypothetical protein